MADYTLRTARHPAFHGSDSMDLMPQANSELAFAFPAYCRDEVARLAVALPQPDLTADSFSVFVDEEVVRIPRRIYQDVNLIDRASLSNVQTEFLDCLLTRHYDGYVREENLRKIVARNHRWIPPFVLQLLGEYVIEILFVIRDGLGQIDQELYRSFLLSNPQFFQLTKQRVVSYRACYYPHLNKRSYVGFEIINSLERLISNR